MANNNNNSNSIFTQVNNKATIYDVVAHYLGSNNVVRKGKIYKAICPFHNDTNPSMNVDPERNTYHCFACGAHGHAIDFVANYTHVKPIEALKDVCKICSIPLPDSFKLSSFVDTFKEKNAKELNALLELKKYYQLNLETVDGKPCQDYLKGRKIEDEVVSHFELGYAGDNQEDSINALRKQGFDVSTLEKAGILTSSSLIDSYKHRLMFPIEDNYGHLVAFSGRILSKDQEGGKYVNYKESALFEKRKVLYHFSKAKEDARRRGYIYVVEGFMDAIAIVRAGVYAVCAIMGTALTVEHAEAFKKLNVEVRLCLDADEAGQVGEERALKVLHDAGVQVKVVRKFDKGKDSDEILTNYGKDVLLSCLQKLNDPFLFLLRRTLKDRKTITDTTEVLTFIKNVMPYYLSLDNLSQEKDIEWLSKVATLSKENLKRTFDNYSVKAKNEIKEKVEAFVPEYKQSEYQEKGYTRRKYYDKRKEPVYDVNCILGEKYHDGDNIISLYELASTTGEGKQFNKMLLKTESEIVFVLTHSYDAFLLYEDARIAFSFKPYYVLANYIAMEYINHPGKKEPFTQFSYNVIRNMIKGTSENSTEKTEEESDPLGLGDDLFASEDEEPLLTLDSDTEVFLLKAIDYIEATRDNCFDVKAMKNSLVLQPLYQKLDSLEKKKISMGDSFSSKDRLEMTNLKIQIKKNGGIF